MKILDRERAVLAHFDEAALVADLVELVRVPSVAGSKAEVEIQEMCAEILRGLDLDVDVWPLDLQALQADPLFPGSEAQRSEALGVVATSKGTGMPALILQGHLDVVPQGDIATWQGMDPFSGEIRDRCVYGRGSCDMKAGVAANIAVVRTLRDAGIVLTRPLAVHCVIGEEDGGLGAFATLRRGHSGEAAVIPEPTSGRIVTATAGALTFRIEVRGRSAHGSMRREGVSAFDAFLPIYEALRQLETARNQSPDPIFAKASLPYALSVGIIRSGEWASNVPDSLVAEGRLGVQLDEDPADARHAMESAIARVCEQAPWLRQHPPQVTWPGGQFASGRIDPEHPLVGQMSAAVVDTGCSAPPFAAEVYGSDLRLYSRIGGIPTLHYGPGDIRVAHSPNEHVEIEDVAGVARALILLALRRCAAEHL